MSGLPKRPVVGSGVDSQTLPKGKDTGLHSQSSNSGKREFSKVRLQSPVVSYRFQEKSGILAGAATRKGRRGSGSSGETDTTVGNLPRSFRSGFSAALDDYLKGDIDAAFERSHMLRRMAVERDIRTYDLISGYQRVLKSRLAFSAGSRATSVLDAGAVLFAALISPFEALEEQAQRIAQALHDESGQLLASVYIALDDLASTLPRHTVPEIKKIRELLNLIELQLRDFSHELYPRVLEDLGLEPTLKLLANGVRRRAHIALEVCCGNIGRLPPRVEIALYRIAQEALTNITRHSKASHARIEFQRNGLMLEGAISDDGVGFDTGAAGGKNARRGLGLPGIESRIHELQGAFSINSTPRGGTRLLLSVPLARKDVYQDLAS